VILTVWLLINLLLLDGLSFEEFCLRVSVVREFGCWLLFLVAFGLGCVRVDDQCCLSVIFNLVGDATVLVSVDAALETLTSMASWLGRFSAKEKENIA
jgi:hypothetical protein